MFVLRKQTLASHTRNLIFMMIPQSAVSRLCTYKVQNGFSAAQVKTSKRALKWARWELRWIRELFVGAKRRCRMAERSLDSLEFPTPNRRLMSWDSGRRRSCWSSLTMKSIAQRIATLVRTTAFTSKPWSVPKIACTWTFMFRRVLMWWRSCQSCFTSTAALFPLTVRQLIGEKYLFK